VYFFFWDGTNAWPFAHIVGKVVTEALHLQYIGAAHHTSLSAELCAQCWAYAWALQCGFAQGIDFHVHYDSIHAGSVSEGVCRTSQEPLLARLTWALRRAVSSVRSVSSSHVKAHDNHPWNEAADALCIMARNQDFRLCSDNLLFQALGSKAGLQWLEARFWPQEKANQYGITRGGTHIRLPSSRGFALQLPSRVIASHLDSQQQDHPGEQWRPEKFRAVSYNALTLRPAGVRKVLAHQFAVKKCLFVGIQEARTSTTAIKQMHCFS